MGDYESQYEAYKNTLLRETYFRRNLTDLYNGSLTVEKDYIDTNGVIWKISLLSAICGFCFALFWLLEDISDARIIITRIVLAVIMILCAIFARRIETKFKKGSAEIKFYAFLYDKYFKDRIEEDKRREMYQFEKDLSSIVVFMQRCTNKHSDDLSVVLEEFQCAFQYVGDLEKQYKYISRYDSFFKSLKDDYYFNTEIQKNIDK